MTAQEDSIVESASVESDTETVYEWEVIEKGTEGGMHGSRGGDRGSGPPPPLPRNFGKNVVIGFVNGTGLIFHIYMYL